MPRTIFLILVAVLIGGCGAALVEPGKRASIGDLYTVEPGIAWSRLARGDTEIWTVNGELLEQLRFVKGIEDGNKLFRTPALADGRQDKLKPPFRADMTPPEIEEFFETSLSQAGALDITTTGLRPFAFGPLAGFRFEFRFSFSDGLPRRGIAVGTVKDKALYLIAYFAPEMYYFDHYRTPVEAILHSIRLTESK